MSYRITTWMIVLALCGQARLIHGETAVNLSADADYQAAMDHQASYEVEFKVAVTPPVKAKKLKVWLPLSQNNVSQQIENRQIKTFPRTVKPSIHRETFFGNQFAYFEFDSPGGTQLITHRFTAKIRQLNWQVDYASVLQPDRWPESFDCYRRIDPRVEEGVHLQTLLDEIGASPAPADRLVSAMKWVDQNLTYDHTDASLSANPMHGLTRRRGHCSDYHGLCSTLAQKIGYPSRVTYGLQMFDKASPSHCKLEVFLPPYGWVTYDLSETQKLVARIGKDQTLTPQQCEDRIRLVKLRTMQGFRENTWLQVTRGTHYELAPPANRPVAVVRTVYAEADGQPLADPDPANPQATSFSWFTMHRVDGDDRARRFEVLEETNL